ncbi:hypothetical protein [Tetragenococcus halophilus]
MDALKTLSMEKQIRTYYREIPDKLAKKKHKKDAHRYERRVVKQEINKKF